MTLVEAFDLLRYWRDYPPVHLLVRPFFRDNETQKPKRIEDCSDSEKSDFLAALASL